MNVFNEIDAAIACVCVTKGMQQQVPGLARAIDVLTARAIDFTLRQVRPHLMIFQ